MLYLSNILTPFFNVRVYRPIIEYIVSKTGTECLQEHRVARLHVCTTLNDVCKIWHTHLHENMEVSIILAPT